MHWFAVLAYAAIANKLIARYRRGTEVAVILGDPEDLRTLAQFELADPAHAHALLIAVADALALEGSVVDGSAIRARRADIERDVDVIRLVESDGRFTLELTRMWTGPKLGAATRALLIKVHDVLAADPRVHRLGWHRRQDRELSMPHAAPVPI